MKRGTYLVFILTLINLFTGCISQKESDKELSIIVTPPENFNPEDEIHIIGSFNDFNMKFNDYKLNYENGKLKGKIPINKDNLFFTFIKNKRDYPASKKGKGKPPYVYQVDSKEKEMKITIPLWTGDKPLEKLTHTLNGNIEYLTDFNMPQLNRKSNISIYLPPSYTSDDSTSYPVLYMLDGQNVFDEFTAYNGEWKIDEIMEKLISENKIKEIIVVAIPNGERRFNEYVPWDYVNRFTGEDNVEKGEGQNTIQFITNTLKPIIDEKYRTRTDVKNTGFAGSSLGGIMALYAGIEYSNTFGFIGAFSPTLALMNEKNEDVLLKAIQKNKHIGDSRIYFDMGKMEYNGYEGTELLEKTLLENGIKRSRIKLVKDDLGRHCEEDWSKRFPGAIRWMLKDLD